MKITTALMALAFATLGLAAAAPASAKNFTIGDPPVAVVAIPSEWSPTEYDEGVEAVAPGNGAYIAVEAVKIKDVESAIIEAVKYFKKKGVTLNGDSMKKRDTKIGGMPAIDVAWEGKDKDGATNISLTFVILSETQSVLLYLWGDDDDLKKAAATLKEIADSLKKVS